MKLLLTAAAALLMSATPPQQTTKTQRSTTKEETQTTKTEGMQERQGMQGQQGTMKTKTGAMGMKEEAQFLNDADLTWGDPPPGLPKGSQVAVLSGDPAKKAPFTIRIRMPEGYKVMPHWHTNDERLTILSGTMVMRMGDDMNSPAHTMETHSFHMLPGKEHHSAEAKTQVLLQIDGMGPFDIHYINKADDPRSQARR
jgi:mannose-6-phosphate isomerase-like protein (cupin superfamily)